MTRIFSNYDALHYFQNEMLNLKQDNERLQRIVASKSLASSQSSLPLSDLTDAPLTGLYFYPIHSNIFSDATGLVLLKI